MTKTKEITNLIVFALVLGAAYAFFITSKPHETAQTQTFVYQEVQAQKAATRIMVQTEAKTVPLPENTSSMPLPINPPKVISEVLPEYPASALERGIEGVVMVQAYIGTSGKAERVEVKASSGNADLDASAASAVTQWVFSPATQGSAAAASWFEVPVRFSLK